MSKFEITIKEQISDDIVKEIQMSEIILGEAKKKMYDAIENNSGDLPDGEYYGILFENSGKVKNDAGAPYPSFTKEDGKFKWTVSKASF